MVNLKEYRPIALKNEGISVNTLKEPGEVVTIKTDVSAHK